MFNKRPLNPLRSNCTSGQIKYGYDALFRVIDGKIQEMQTSLVRIALDGTHGADFQTAIQKIVDPLEKRGYEVLVVSTYSFLKSGEKLRVKFKDHITDNRAFGFVTEAEIGDYFRKNAKRLFQRLENASAASVESGQQKILLVFGPGANWLGDSHFDAVFFLDVSREYQQIEHRKQLLNFGMSWNRDAVEKYKICYFVEWPVLETYRRQVLKTVDYYVDLNNVQNPTLVAVSDLLSMISCVAKAPMRVKPFFAPGVWGGQYLKELADLPENWVNCAWSFEPIAPENSILIGQNENVIEIPFLLVMAYASPIILGDRLVRLFGDYFPIRFDFLDTIDGDNLSCQVHPKQDYLRNHFNDFMEQQESYYIMEQKGNSKVYLGLTESTTRDNFYDAVQMSQESGVPIQLTEYVNEWEANKGDLFLIPTGTVHCSGKNNLVLEISATTWWFTFKIYDYLRKDLDGKPRPINMEFAFDNIDFYKSTGWVKRNLIPQPILLSRQGANEEYELGKRDDLLFYVNRIQLIDEWVEDTCQELMLLNLVEGDQVRIVSLADESVFVEFGYAESYILPAVFGKFKIINLGNIPCKLIKAGVSPDWEMSLIER